jgi:hypothetical protein
MSAQDWTQVVGTIGVFALVISVVIVGIWQLAATLRARATLAREREYRTLADRSALVQESTERQLAEIGAGWPRCRPGCSRSSGCSRTSSKALVRLGMGGWTRSVTEEA